jgi:hypothetical protein
MRLDPLNPPQSLQQVEMLYVLPKKYWNGWLSEFCRPVAGLARPFRRKFVGFVAELVFAFLSLTRS